MPDSRKFGTSVAVVIFTMGVYISWYIWKKKMGKRNFRTLCIKQMHLIETENDWNSIWPELMGGISHYKILGIDCEWVPQFDKGTPERPVSLLQLATVDGLCILIRIHKFLDIPQSLKDLLSNKKIIKAGVASMDDAHKLKRDYDITVNGCVDLRALAKRSRKYNFRGYGLQNLTKEVLGVHLEKKFSIRCSNWETDVLSDKQCEYAALDALAGAQIIMQFADDKYGNIDQKVAEGKWSDVVSMCQGIIDVKFSKTSSKYSSSRSCNKTDGGNKTALKNPKRAYLIRTNPFYNNCHLYAPDMSLLCTCDIKKAQWYIDKDLAEKVGDDPFSIKLKFEPSGRPTSDVNYYMIEKDNICVVCGNSQSYIRKNIVPREYRKHFPAIMKEHKSHDVLLLCMPCHQQSDVYDIRLKEKLADECNAPYSSHENVKYEHDFIMGQVRSAGKALLLSGAKIPQPRKLELEKIVRDYYGVAILDNDLLVAASLLDSKIANLDHVAHGEKVIKHYMEQKGLVAFELLWREHFLEAMQPKFLPELWSLDHGHDRLTSMDKFSC